VLENIANLGAKVLDLIVLFSQ